MRARTGVLASVRHDARDFDQRAGLEREVESPQRVEFKFVDLDGLRLLAALVLAADKIDFHRLLDAGKLFGEAGRRGHERVTRLEHAVQDRLISTLSQCGARDGQIDVQRTHVPAAGIEQIRDPSPDEHDVVTKDPQHVEDFHEHGVARHWSDQRWSRRASCQRWAASFKGAASNL